MKRVQFVLTLALVALTALVGAVHGILPAALVAFIAGNALVFADQVPARLFATLTPTVLLQQTMRKLFVHCPALFSFSSEFTTERLLLNQQVIGKIRLRPTVSTYDRSAGGYKNGSQESRDLLMDVPFVMDQHIHVTVSLQHLNALTDSIIKMQEHIEDSASVIGDTVARYILGKVKSSSFSNATTYTEANSNKDALNAMRKALNLRGVPGMGRFGLVNSNVAETLSNDARITNRYDDRSKDTEDAYITLRQLSGFESVREDPALATGNTTPIAIVSTNPGTEVITVASAHGFAINDRVKVVGTGAYGLTAGGFYFVKTVPSTTSLTVSATRGGAPVDITGDETEGTIAAAENIIGFFGRREAIAIKTALPQDSIDIARAIGINVPVSDEVVTDPDSGLSMALYKWFETGTHDAYVTLACLFGATAGALADTGHHVMEPSGQILRSA